MAGNTKSSTVREAVGIFFDAEKLEQTIDDLKSSGFGNEELGLLAGEFTVKQKLGHLYSEVNKDTDDPHAPRTAFVRAESVGDTVHGLLGTLYIVGAAIAGGAVVASLGVMAGGVAAATGTVAVFGSLGAVLAKILQKSDAEFLEEQVDRGHLLLFVRTLDTDHEKQALEILSRHSAFDPKIYSIPSNTTTAD